MQCDVGIVGAGVAGLAAAAALTRAGKQVRCLEASGRVGGRILTVHDPLSPAPIELGAEFVHGRPEETWSIIRDGGLTAFEHTAHALHIDQGRVLDEKEVGEIAERVMAGISKTRKQRDESFDEFLQRSHQRPDIKKWAGLYVEGFNAARKERIGIQSLKKDKQAAASIDGDRTFRIWNGYDSLVQFLLRSIEHWENVVQLNSIVERVAWTRGRVTISYRSALNNRKLTLRCKRLIVTAPLGVLQSVAPATGAILFDPEPSAILKAARALEFGQAFRITFRFAVPFWEEDERLNGAGFLLSREQLFPTWWTTHPVISPLLTGWTAGAAADPLRGMDRSTMVAEALGSLARILNRRIPEPVGIYFHDWHADPFARGAYSYVPAGAMAARKALARPVDDTLFFAGEAAQTTGHASMVHGAIASGIAAARKI